AARRAYTARWYGCRLIVAAERWFASPRTCSGCGWSDETLTLADRTLVCQRPDRPACGLVRDCDLHAAQQLRQAAREFLGQPNACGAGSAGGGHVDAPCTCPR